MPLHGNTIYMPQRESGSGRRSKAPFAPVNSDEASLKKFNERIDDLIASTEWACRALGQFDLSYEEALLCEETCRQQVEKDLPRLFWKPILDYVDQKVQSMAVLITDISLLLQAQYLIGEKVQFVEGKDSSEVTFEVVARAHKNRNVFNTAHPSTSKQATSMDWQLMDVQRCKNLRYSLSSISLNKALRIDGVSFSVLRRLEPKMPTQKVLRMFIRSFAHKLSYHSGYHPWLVDKEVKEMLSLPDGQPKLMGKATKVAKSPLCKQAAGRPKRPAAKGGSEKSAKTAKKSHGCDIRRFIQPKPDPAAGGSPSKSAATQANSQDRTPASSGKQSNGRKVQKLLTPSKASPSKDFFGRQNAESRFARRFKLVQATLERHFANRGKAGPAGQSYKKYAEMIAREFTVGQLEGLNNEVIRKEILQRKMNRENRLKLKNMTAEQKMSYLRQQKEERRLKMIEERKKIEDKLIVPQTSLPEPELVDLPEGFTGKMFGDAVEIMSFVHCFSELLEPNASVNLSIFTFLRHLASKEAHNEYLSTLLVLFLRPILADSSAGRYKYLGVKLQNLELNSVTAAEITRLVFNQIRTEHEEDDSDEYSSGTSSSSLSSSQNTDVRNVVESLDAGSFGRMEAALKIQAFSLLMNSMLATSTLKRYLEKMVANLATARQHLTQCSDEWSAFEKEKGKENGDAGSDSAKKDALVDGEQLTKLSGISLRQHAMLQEKMKREEEIRAADLRYKREKTALKLKTRLSQAEKTYKEITLKAKLCVRLSPKGRDRNGSRYWFFGSWAPGLFVEKGWFADSSIVSPSSSDVDRLTNANEWRHFKTEQSIVQLIEALMQKGVREGPLKEVLESIKCDIIESLAAGSQSSDVAYEEQRLEEAKSIADMFKADLLDLEQQLTTCAMNKYGESGDDWSAKLAKAEELEDMKVLLIDLQQSLKRSVLTSVMGVRMEGRLLNAEISDQVVQQLQGMEASRLHHINLWKEAVQHCASWERLYLLLHVLKACIDWDRCIVKKCRVCRRQRSETECVCCNGCNAVYHRFCLRPAFDDFDTEFWCHLCSPYKQLYLILEGKGDFWTTPGPPKFEADVSDRESDDTLSRMGMDLKKRQKLQLKKENEFDMREICSRILQKVTSSRLASSLSVPHDRPMMETRRRRLRKIVTLQDVKDSLANYESLIDFFRDLKAVIEHAQNENRSRKRTYDQLQQLQAMVESLEEQETNC